MQSGQANTKSWVMVIEPAGRSTPDPIMGWNSSADTGRQVTLRFDSKDDAVAYARKNGYTYTVREAKTRTARPKADADNSGFHASSSPVALNPTPSPPSPLLARSTIAMADLKPTEWACPRGPGVPPCWCATSAAPDS